MASSSRKRPQFHFLEVESSQMPTSDFLFLSQLANAMRAYWLRGTVTFLILMTGVGFATLVCPRTYQSEARIYVRLGRETVHLDPTATTGQTVQLADSREREIYSVLELLRSRALYEKVVDQLGVDSILHERRSYSFGGLSDWSFLLEGHLQPPVENERAAVATPDSNATDHRQTADVQQLRLRESAVRSLMQSISCSSPKSSNVIIITCSAPSPVSAQERLNCLLENYQEQHLRVNRISGSLAFFDGQVQEKKRSLDAKLLERRDAKNRIAVGSVESQHDLLSKEAVAITDSLLDAQAACAAAEARLESLLATMPQSKRSDDVEQASGTSVGALNLMRARLFELEIERERLQAQLQPKNPRLTAITEQVAQTKSLLQRQEIVVERSTILELRKKIAAAEAQHADVYAKLRNLNENEVEIADIDRQIKLLESEYRKADEYRDQARTDEELTRRQISNINVAQSPSFSAKPVSPNLGLNLMLGFAVAFGGALAVAFISAVRNGLAESQAATTFARTASPATSKFHPAPEALLRSASQHPLTNGA